jgi:hypothetical protein
MPTRYGACMWKRICVRCGMHAYDRVGMNAHPTNSAIFYLQNTASFRLESLQNDRAFSPGATNNEETEWT